MDWSIKILVGISVMVLVFHVLVLAEVLPSDIVWAGRPMSEGGSIFWNPFPFSSTPF